MSELFDNPASKADRLKPYQYKRKDYTFDRDRYIVDGKVDRQALLKDARKVAKATNQRLLRLEREDLTSAPAYRGAVKALSGLYNKTDGVAYGSVTQGKPRYKERVNSLSNEQLLDMLYTLSHTQNAVTSTVGKAKAAFGVGLANLNALMAEMHLPNLTLNDYLTFFRSSAMTEASKAYGYRALLQAFSDMGENLTMEEKISTIKEASADLIAENKDNLIGLRKKLGLDNKPPAKGWKKL